MDNSGKPKTVKVTRTVTQSQNIPNLYEPDGMGDYYKKLYFEKASECARLRQLLHCVQAELSETMQRTNDAMADLENKNTIPTLTEIKENKSNT